MLSDICVYKEVIMFGSQMLDVVIGLAFVYLLLSLICSTLMEMVARLLALRSNTLEEAIRHILEDNSKSKSPSPPEANIKISPDEFYKNELIRTLGKQSNFDRVLKFLNEQIGLGWILNPLGMKGEGRSSYIPSSTFALALFDIIKTKGSQGNVKTNDSYQL